MSQSIEVFASSTAAIDAGSRSHRPNGFLAGGHGRSVTDQTRIHSGKQTDDAESIIGELVNQFLHCSTTTSGIFCW